jgi:hypothetical protein
MKLQCEIGATCPKKGQTGCLLVAFPLAEKAPVTLPPCVHLIRDISKVPVTPVKSGKKPSESLDDLVSRR